MWRMRNSMRSSPSARSFMEASSSLKRSRSVGCMCLVKSSILADSSPALRPRMASTTGLTLISSRRSLHSHTPAPAPSTASDLQLLLAGLHPVERLERAERVLRDREADQHHDQHQPGRQPEHDDVARQAAGEGDAGAEQPHQQQHPGGHQRQCAVLAAHGQEQRQRAPGRGDEDAGQARKGGRQPRVEEGHGDEHELRRHPQQQQHAHEAVPGPEPQEGVEEDKQGRRHAGLGGGAVLRVLLGADVEQLVPEAEVHAQIGQHAPGEDGGRGEDGLVVGGEHGGQEDGEQAGDAQHDAVEELAVPALLLVLDGLPQEQAGEAVGGELGHEGDGLPGLQREAEHVGAVVLHALGDVADGGRDGIDAARVEVGPHHARAHHAVAVGGEPALHGLVGGVGEREHEPCRVGAGGGCPHGHAAAHAVGARRGLDLQGIAASLVGLAQRGDLDAVEVVGDGDRLQCVGRGGVRAQAGREQAGERKRPRRAPRPRSHSGPAARCYQVLPILTPAHRLAAGRTDRDPARGR